MKKVVLVLIAILLMPPPAKADNLNEVEVFMQERLNGIMSLLQDKTLQKEARNEKIISIITEAFDFRTMAKLSLGKRHWIRLNKEDRHRFIHLFVERLKLSYLEKLDLYDDEKIVYKKPTALKNKVRFMTELVSGKNKITMLYKLYKSKKLGWRVYDLELEGVSLITTYRSQFNEVLATGNMTDLFAKLERPEK